MTGQGTLGRTYRDGERIVVQGDEGDCMFVVQAGRVEVVQTDAAGTERRLGMLTAGEFFGEMAMFEPEARSATVRAVGDAVVLRIDKKTLLRRIAEDPLLAVRLLQTVCSRLREANARAAAAGEGR